MGGFFYERDADLGVLAGQRVAVVGYGNQGRPWALNMRDSGLAVSVHVRADQGRDQSRQNALSDGFEVGEVAEACDADIICVLVSDDAIASLGLVPDDEALTIVASGYTLAFERFSPPGDVAMVAPRMLGPEVRRCYSEGVGFITAVGVQQDRTGTAESRMLAVAKAIGGLRQGAIAMTPHQEAVLDLAVEQLLSPALTYVNTNFVMVLLEQGIPLEAITTELFFSGEVERNYRLLREEGFVAQLDHHSPASQYGQLSRRGRFDHLDVASTMKQLLADISSGRFADEWDGESQAGAPRLAELREMHAGELMRAVEADLRSKLGPDAALAHQ
ncbi:MAG: ketol-acid reductoisomerase [Acidimicrobiia bacterium]|nr:ketol-acid reductoisomerase [Acidimicrobiia bacterium]MYC57920.1 ketol-acid reductoisomerase [Acidimicrobiia bacterium]MYG93376.1 ketol-acid reductoisomerase [Acidimicrobiia bacterium]MYI29843.1 ketol-acid reductoisomerase [Acidimicrobiia bacterium]